MLKKYRNIIFVVIFLMYWLIAIFAFILFPFWEDCSKYFTGEVYTGQSSANIELQLLEMRPRSKIYARKELKMYAKNANFNQNNIMTWLEFSLQRYLKLDPAQQPQEVYTYKKIFSDGEIEYCRNGQRLKQEALFAVFTFCPYKESAEAKVKEIIFYNGGATGYVISKNCDCL